MNELTVVNPSQQAIVNQVTPPSVIKIKVGRGGKKFRYVSTDYVIRSLNEAFGFNWNFEILDSRLFPNEQEPIEAIVTGRLTIHGPNGQLIKTQFGGSECKKLKSGKGYVSIADDLKSAGSDALKKCASLVGLALDLYGDTPPVVETKPAQAQQKPSNGNSKSAKVLFTERIIDQFGITPAEIGAIISLIGGFDESRITTLESWLEFVVSLCGKFDTSPQEVYAILRGKFDQYDTEQYLEQHFFVSEALKEKKDEVPF